MLRRLRFILFAGVVLATILATGMVAGASPEVRDKEAEVGSAQERLEAIRMESSAAYETYNSALFQLNELDARIGETEEELAAAEDRMVEAKASLEDRASQVYRSGNVGFVDVLVGADSFAEFSSRMNIWLRLLGEEQARFAEMREATEAVETQKTALENQRAERVSALEEAGAQRDLASDAEAEAQAYLDSLSGELQAAIEEEEARKAEEARLAAEQAAAVEPVEVAQVAQVEKGPSAAEIAAEREAALAAQQRAEELAAQQQAAEDAAAEAERQAELAAEREAEDAERRQAEAAAAREAAEQAAIEQEAAERAAAQQAAAEEAAAARQAAAEQAAAEQAAAEQAAAEQAAAEQAAAEEAAAAEQAALDQAAAEEAEAAEQAAVNDAQYGNNADGNMGGGATGGNTAPAAGGGGSANGGGIVGAAQAQLGVPYVYGGADPSGFDCSGLVMYVFAQFGVSLPHNAAAQFGYGSPGSGAAGDVVFWDSGGGISHNGIATGSGTVIHAPYPGTVVREEGIWQDGLAGYKTMA